VTKEAAISELVGYSRVYF